MFEEAGAGNVDRYFDRAHQICKIYFDEKSLKKNVKAWLLNSYNSEK